MHDGKNYNKENKIFDVFGVVVVRSHYFFFWCMFYNSIKKKIYAMSFSRIYILSFAYHSSTDFHTIDLLQKHFSSVGNG